MLTSRNLNRATRRATTPTVMLRSDRRLLQLLCLASLHVALLAVLGVGACSKSGSPTAPYGGGGGTGTPFNLGPFGLNQSATLTFANAGTFGYHCIPHQAMGMTGSVQVEAGGADSAVVQIAASGLTYTPPTTHIRPGGHVRWVNASASTVHTVTSN
jgi:hypothetical protein